MSQPPRRFRPYETADDEAGPDAKTRRIDSPAAADKTDPEAWQQMVNPDWRGARRRTPTPTGPLPFANNQKMMKWVQSGGWRMLAGGAIAILLLLTFVLFNNKPSATNATRTSIPSTQNLNPTIPPGQIVQGTPPAIPNPQVGVTPVPANASVLAVSGTNTEGLFLRSIPSSSGAILKTMPEGTQVQKLGEQQSEGRLWFNIRDTSTNLEGWSAADWLKPVP